MDYLLSIIIGVLSSLIAAIVFLSFIYRLKPKISISKRIAKGQNSKGDTVYRIKIINRTRRPLVDIRAEFNLLTYTAVPEGIIEKYKEIELFKSNPMEIAGFDRKDKEARYAYRFVIYKDLDTLWRDDIHSFLRFNIYAVDSLSGFGKVFTQNYHTKRNTLIDGDFEFGDSLEIK